MHVKRESAYLIVAALLLCPLQSFAQSCDARFKFDGNLSDSGGGGYNGQMITKGGIPAAAQFVDGRFGQALRLNGGAAMRAFVDLNSDDCPQVTIAAWINAGSDEPTGSQHIVSTGSGSGPGIRTLGTSLVLHGTANGLIQSTAIRRNAGWMFVAGVYDYEQGTYTLYWRGRSKTTELGKYRRQPEDALWVGALNDGMSGPAKNILIDELQIIGKALSKEDISALQKSANTGLTNRAALPQAVPGVSERFQNNVPDISMEDRQGSNDYDLLRNAPGPLAEALDAANSGTDETEATPNETISQMEEDILAAQALSRGATDPDLTAPEGLPGELPQNSEEWEEARLKEYQRQQNEKFENNFGPRDRTQIVVGQNRSLAFGARKITVFTGPGDPTKSGIDIENWHAKGSIREILRLKNTDAYLAIDAEGTVAIQGAPNGRHTDLAADIADIVANERSIDLVAEGAGGYLIISGTEVVSKGLPPGALVWAEQQLRLRTQITAFALLGGDAWIGVSTRGITTRGMNAQHYGVDVREKATQLLTAGERIEDISASYRHVGSGAYTGAWAIATDRQIYYENNSDCDNHEDFAVDVESRLASAFNCHVPVEPCPNNRPTWTFSNMESPANPDAWDVNVLVTIGVADYDGEEKARLDCWLESSLRRTEELYDRQPPIKLHLQTRRETQMGGRDLSDLEFSSTSDYRAFMDQYFDIMAPTDTSGYFQIVVTNRLCIGEKDGEPNCIGGRATFPHAVAPFSRKFGISLDYDDGDEDDTVLAHEFGHYLGLKHTFEPYGVTTNTCNSDYDANWLYMEERYCRSCLSGMDLVNDECDGLYNVMDYCENPTNPQQVYVNDCQERRAVNSRERYMQNDGRTKYGKMKGSMGADP